jgi:hypothetical protein
VGADKSSVQLSGHRDRYGGHSTAIGIERVQLRRHPVVLTSTDEVIGKRNLDRRPYRVWVLCGDSEMAEGSMWEALDKASRPRRGKLPPARLRRRAQMLPAA